MCIVKTKTVVYVEEQIDGQIRNVFRFEFNPVDSAGYAIHKTVKKFMDVKPENVVYRVFAATKYINTESGLGEEEERLLKTAISF